jgi:hypothetical protein
MEILLVLWIIPSPILFEHDFDFAGGSGDSGEFVLLFHVVGFKAESSHSSIQTISQNILRSKKQMNSEPLLSSIIPFAGSGVICDRCGHPEVDIFQAEGDFWCSCWTERTEPYVTP